jgi:hypothetical protein
VRSYILAQSFVDWGRAGGNEREFNKKVMKRPERTQKIQNTNDPNKIGAFARRVGWQFILSNEIVHDKTLGTPAVYSNI